jgi:hypothetical protein
MGDANASLARPRGRERRQARERREWLEEADGVQSCQADQDADDPSKPRVLPAEDGCHEVALEQADQAPVHAADDDRSQGYHVERFHGSRLDASSVVEVGRQLCSPPSWPITSESELSLPAEGVP